MTHRPHNLSLDQLDRIAEQVRAETMLSLSRGEASASGASAAHRDAGNLDHSTPFPENSSLPRYSITLLDFGDVIECRAVYVASSIPCSRKTTSERIEGTERTNSCYEDPDKLLWRIRRSQRLLRWRALSLKADAIWTLTKRGKFETPDDCYEALTNWLRRVEYWRGEKLRYVAVPEQHADGRWHMHIAVSGFVEVGMLRRLWYKTLGGRGDEKGADAPGSINITRVKGRKCSAKVARYISKYVGKSFGVFLRKNRLSFWSSKGLGAFKVVRWSEPVHMNESPLLMVKKKVEQYQRGNYESFEWNFAGTSGFIIKTAGS